MTKVINIKEVPSNWEMDYRYQYIGRKGKGQDGYWGNPFKLSDNAIRGSSLNKYENYLVNKLKTDERFNQSFYALKGVTLVCFCKPEPCHGDVMKKYLDDMPRIMVNDE